MKQLMFFVTISLVNLPGAQAQSGKRILAEAFRRHFHRLDSLAQHSPTEVVPNCYQEIQFMEAHTGIISLASGDWLGLFHCYKSDVAAWHKWYTRKYEHKRN